MITKFIVSTVLETLVAVLIILGFVFEEKVIDFEEKCENKIAKKIARIIIKFRKLRKIAK